MTESLCHLSDVIPVKFHKYSGVHDYQFTVRNERPFQNYTNMPGWPCSILKDSMWNEIYLPYEIFPNEVEALAILSPLDGESEREGRYIKIHVAYEAVVNDRETDYSAIRHFLVHPIVRLTRPNVQKSIVQRFGPYGLDLREYYHQKEFYRCIGQMLIAIDKTVHENVISAWGKIINKKPNKRLKHD